MSVLQKLTEGIVHRDVQKEGAALLNKWEKTGLLEGLGDDRNKNTMAVLLENQAKELLREASSMAAGDVEGFAAVAFPIVRRVFGGLIANDLVSVQPMSLPSGLIFFLDFTHTHGRAGVLPGESVYGGHVVGRQITGGVQLGLDPTQSDRQQDGGGGFYDLGTGYSSPTGSHVGLAQTLGSNPIIDVSASAFTQAQKKHIRFDPDVLSDNSNMVTALQISASSFANGGDLASLNRNALTAISQVTGSSTGATLVRRLTKFDSDGNLQLFFVGRPGAAPDVAGGDGQRLNLSFPVADNFNNANAGNGGADTIGAVVGADVWGLEEPSPSTGEVGSSSGKQRIPEIDIKVDSIAVTAVTKKLKAKWTPELGQDLNAYHNLDAEVELTGILSEQIALEIDQEILGDLIVGAKAGTRYWSRAPGLFVDSNGSELGATSAAPDFTGTVSEWYETLIETINDVSAQIHRKTLRGGANFVVCSPEVANILEFTSGFRASVTADADRGTVGAVKSGSLSKKWDVYVDPYFPRNVVLVGRKGGSFLESGYVYAPYVPLQVTPTIFGTEDFVPRKGVMTRYAKKMVRPDMYGLVIVRGLLGEAGS